MAVKNVPTKKQPTKKAAAPKAGGPRQMSASHKAALGAGREESRTVRQYLDALDARQPRRGRKRTSETITKRLSTVESQLSDARGLTRVHLLQEREDLTSELAKLEGVDNFEELESGFVAVGKSYSDRKGISYGVWTDVGVPAAVLKRAGISRR